MLKRWCKQLEVLENNTMRDMNILVFCVDIVTKFMETLQLILKTWM